MRAQQKVLVLGDDTQSFLAVVRSLGRHGIRVHAAPFNFRSPALASRYIDRIHRIPRYVGSGEAWCEAVVELLERERFDFVVPVDDRNVLCFQRFRGRLEGLSRIAIPSDEAIEVFYDKHRTRELAQRCGVPVPAGRLLRDDDSARTISSEFSLPVVIKPRRSYTLASLHDRGKVAVVDSEENLKRVLERIARRGDHVVECFFNGRGVGVSVLVLGGTIVYGFEHHRLVEGPGGGSTLRVSASLDAALLAACQRMLAALSYTGVAMFEFRQDFAGGASVLLEVNARFWGSLPLPLSIGVDFPHDLLRVLSGEFVAPRTYRPKIYARNLIADAYASTQRLPASAGLARKGLAAFREVLPAVPRMINGKERSDTFVRDDLSPGVTEIARVARTAISRMARPLAQSLPGASALRRRRIRRALEECRADARIVFLCQGNICRSPFAEHLLERELGSQCAMVSVTSVGLLPVPGRRCPEQAVRAALDRGIDLTGHVSRFLDDSGLSRAGLVFVFDRMTLEDFRDRFPAAAPPVFLLAGLLDGADRADIEDPLGRGPEFFADTYARIEQAVGELLPIVRSSCI